MSDQPVIGNDIVDLHFVDLPPYDHIGHLERVCTAEESLAVRRSADPSTYLAAIWASKEASYKALVQRGFDSAFVPREFVTHFENSEQLPCGQALTVSYGGIQCHVKVALTGRWVHAIAMHPQGCLVRWAVVEIKDWEPRAPAATESAAARRLALNLLSRSCGNDIRLEFSGRVPLLRRETGTRAGMGISLSHHGSFAAAALSWLPGTTPRLRNSFGQTGLSKNLQEAPTERRTSGEP